MTAEGNSCSSNVKCVDGFTLIEIVIVAVIMAVVVALLSNFLVAMLGNTQRTSSTTDLQVKTTTFIQVLANDLRHLESPVRSDQVLPGSSVLRQFVLYGTPISGHTYSEALDIVRADSSSLWFRADVIPEARAAVHRSECVGYYRNEAGRFVRAVYASWRQCPAALGTAPLEERTMMPKLVAGQSAVGPFQYTLRYNSHPEKIPLNPSDCVNVDRLVTPTDAQLNHIVYVRIDANAMTQSHLSNAESHLTDGVSVRTRLAHDYQFALGCAF